MINVVNDALFTGDLSLAKTHFDDLLAYHVYKGWFDANANATGPAKGLLVARDPTAK